MGLSWASHSTLIYTSELILSAAPFVFMVLRGTTFICTLLFTTVHHEDSPPFPILFYHPEKTDGLTTVVKLK